MSVQQFGSHAGFPDFARTRIERAAGQRILAGDGLRLEAFGPLGKQRHVLAQAIDTARTPGRRLVLETVTGDQIGILEPVLAHTDDADKAADRGLVHKVDAPALLFAARQAVVPSAAAGRRSTGR